MSHKAGNEFFAKKKEWSKRKDIVLGYYLTPYLAKVAHLGRPILVVDGFAGPGKFDDGQPGSPLVICSKVQEAIDRGTRVNVLCVEQDADLYLRLQENLRPFRFAQCRNDRFHEILPEIEAKAHSHTVFLYVDPFTIEGVVWDGLNRIFAHLTKSRSSIELLFNFNVPSLVRRGLATLKMGIPIPSEESEEDEVHISPIERLNSFADGNWWIDILRRQTEFQTAVSEIGKTFCERLQLRFKEVCQHPVKAKVEHSCPKYILVFASRSSDALLLMNAAMVRSRETFAENSAPATPTLFETRPFEIVPDNSRLPDLVWEACSEKMTRTALILRVIRQAFCDFGETEIRRCIERLVDTGRLRFSSSTFRLNENAMIWRAPAR
jgi:three-Cys-motif partner protein